VLLLGHHTTGLLAESEDDFAALSDPTDAALEACVANFTKAVSVDVARVGCAGCGVMAKDDDSITRLKVGPATLHLVRSNPDFEPTYRSLSDLGKSAHHVMEVGGVLHHVAPRLVGADGVGAFCARCAAPPAKNESKGMKHFRFVDRDYGVHFWSHDALNHARLSMLEEMALSRVLPYVVTVKLTSRSNTAATWSMRSHAFCLPHDGQSELERQLLQAQPPVETSALCTAEELVNPRTPLALTYTFIGTKTAYRVLRECYPTLLHGLAINPTVAAAFIKYHAEAGHPDFKRFRSRLPADLPGVLATSLEALRTQIVENIAFDDSALINVVEGHMQATGNGASVIAEASQAPFDDRHLLDHVSRVCPPSATNQLSVSAVLRNELLNEYTDNHEIYQSAFPGLFPLGVPKTQHGHFPKHAWKTMLDSYQSGFERSVAFVGYSGDAKMRRERSLASSLAVKSSKHFPAFEALVSDSAFHEKMTVAVRNPQGATASELMKVLKPVFCLANKHVPWSRGERKAESGRLAAVTRRFGPPTMMVTVSPNATDEPLVVCLALRKLGAAWKPKELWRESAADMRARRALTEGAPASCVTFYDEFTRAVLTHLFGAELDRSGELDPKDLREGIFGRCRAAHGVTEAQGRGHLHMHVLLWTVHGPLFFARFLHDADKRDHLIKRINVLVTAQLAKDGKITSRHKCRDPPPLAPRPASPPGLVEATAAVTLSNNGDEAAPENPPPTSNAAGPWNPESPFPERPRNLEEARAAASSSGARHLLHACCKRCRKPPKGHIMCAMAFSRPPAAHTTIDQCHLCDSDPKVPVADRALCMKDDIDPPPSEEVPAGMPVSPLDTRLLCMRLQRIHLQDCFTSETNEVLQGCAKHMNTNVSSPPPPPPLLSSSSQTHHVRSKTPFH